MNNEEIRIDRKKFEELRAELKELENTYYSEINKALSDNDVEAFNHVKQLQLQCTAQLRLMKNIDKNLEDENYITC